MSRTKHQKGRDPYLYASVVLALFFSVWVYSVDEWNAPMNFYEDVSFSIAPSAEKASLYGHRHFQSSQGSAYDVERAKYFYEKVLELDPSDLTANHQLARIEFLEGNFFDAMQYINRQIEIRGDAQPNSYYVRGLIEGFMGSYDAAAYDYERYLSLIPSADWAGITDYAWVLLKAGRHEEARDILELGLVHFPDNAWLLNNSAIALYEIGDYALARERSKKAVDAADKVTEEMWLKAYPGNDPRIAPSAVTSFRMFARETMHRVGLASTTTVLQ